MDLYGLSAQDCFRIDDLLDFSNDEIFSSSSTDSDLHFHHHHPPPPQNPTTHFAAAASSAGQLSSLDFTSDLCVPSDDVAELEWLSRFVDDSFADLPTNELAGAQMFTNDTSLSSRARSKRSRLPSTSWASPGEMESPIPGKPNSIRESSPSKTAATGSVRRCTHCASEKTPQWRTGPMGPKTLCNACGVRYKSGRLVPEYRPAASPTFVLTQHSNSHRKVMELRRQKEVIRQQQQQTTAEQNQQQQIKQEQFYSHHHGFPVC
ncbi:hypothetical protein UlMin_021451 [Ulmus minor]